MRFRRFALGLVLALMVGCATSPDNLPRTISLPATATTIATVQPASNTAVDAARLRLTKNGLEDPGLVAVVNITSTTWLDDCLGLPSGMTCHSKTTPGFVIELEKGGQRYLVHTDQDGKQVRLARSPFAPIRDAFVQWQYADSSTCETALIGADQMRYGLCGEAMLAASSNASMWSIIKGESQASYLSQKYAPFTANTIRGTLVFTSTGALVASQEEQRAIAEWAWTRFEDANANYLPADYGLEFYWQEKSTSLCGTLWVYRTGLAVAWDCQGN